MTRRTALAILVTVWISLLVGGVAAYVTTRSVLLADLDAALVDRASSVPPILGEAQVTNHDPDDRYLVRNEFGRTIARPAPPQAVSRPQVIGATFATLGDGRRLRTLSVRAMRPAGPVTMVYSGSADRFDAVLRQLAAALAVSGAVTGAAAAGVAVWVSHAALRPLRATADAIGAIDESKLDRRIDPASLPPELLPLADRLNEMLGRLEQAAAQQRQFLADAAHELRTPIAAILTGLEVGLRRPRSGTELAEVLGGCLDDARRLQRLALALLEHVRTGRSVPDDREQLCCSALLEECARTAAALAAPRQVAVTRRIAPNVWLQTSRRRLESAVLNLLANAVQYSRPGGEIELGCAIDGGVIAVWVRDTGIGITPSELSHVFEPFFRANRSRSQEPEDHHLGLGLYLVRAHVRSLGGRIDATSEPGKGTLFRIELPVATDPSVPRREVRPEGQPIGSGGVP
jgi:signal transduction histidine kinase